MKKDYFKRLKRERHNELKYYYRKMNIIYDLFNDYPIADCEFEVFEYLQTMSVYEIEKMFVKICFEFDIYDMSGALGEPMLLKYEIMKYIQKIRNGE